MFKFLPVLILSFSVSSGCAYIVNSKLVEIPVQTTPAGATITVNNNSYTSPATVLLPRAQGDFNLHIEKQGYQSVDILLTESIDIAVAGNFTGPLGLAIDFITGYAFDLEPEFINANLNGTTVTKLNDGTLQLILVDLNDLPPHLALRIKQNKKYQQKLN